MKKGTGKNGNDGGDFFGAFDGDDIIEFSPDGAFSIHAHAQNFSELMIEMEMPVLMHLPHISVEFEPGCTAKEIIDGFEKAQRTKIKIKHANDAIKPK